MPARSARHDAHQPSWAREIGPFALYRVTEEGISPLVDIFAQLGDLTLRDAGQAHRLHQLVDAPGRDTPIQALDHHDQR